MELRKRGVLSFHACAVSGEPQTRRKPDRKIGEGNARGKIPSEHPAPHFRYSYRDLCCAAARVSRSIALSDTLVNISLLALRHPKMNPLFIARIRRVALDWQEAVRKKQNCPGPDRHLRVDYAVLRICSLGEVAAISDDLQEYR